MTKGNLVEYIGICKKANKPTRRLNDTMDITTEWGKDQQEQGQIIATFVGTVKHFFGEWGEIFKDVNDGRNPEMITYPLGELLFTGVLMYLCHLGSRRDINYKLRGNESAEEKSRQMFGTEHIPHGDTLEYGFQKLKVEDVQQVVSWMTATLVRKKVLAKWRLFDWYYLVAIDGTGVLSFSERHCPYCMTQKLSNGAIRYYHPVLEAKLITANGFAFSLMTEFIENRDPEASKQDCELKAFYRLAKRLKKQFPRLPMCLLMDGLYAGGPTFKVCEQNDWKYLIVLRDDDLPDINQEFEALLKMAPDCRRQIDLEDGSRQFFRWMNSISYTDSNFDQHLISVLESVQISPDDQGKENASKHKWITNFTPTSINAPKLSSAGRSRWKIENEGFNLQKNGGYRLEHPYSHHEVACKVFYLLLQIAFTIFQLMAKGSLFQAAFPKGVGSLKNIAFRLLEAWRNLHCEVSLLDTNFFGHFQIRLDTS